MSDKKLLSQISNPGDVDREVRGDAAPHRGPGVRGPARQLCLPLREGLFGTA